MSRYYNVGGRNLVSVTTVLDAVINPGEGLLRWACNLGWKESRRVFREAGQRGTRVHEYIGRDLATRFGGVAGVSDLPEGLPEGHQDDVPYTASWDVFRDILLSLRGLAVIGSEQSVSCLPCGYAGTLDVYGQITNESRYPRMILADYKTSSRIRTEVAFQTAAYAHALMGHDVPPAQWPERWAIRLQRDGSMPECKRFFRNDRDWAGFSHALSLFNILKEMR